VIFLEKTTSSIKELKRGGFVIIDGDPCYVEGVDVSKSGKHGASKARLEAVGMFDGRRRSVVKPADDTVDVPILTKKKAQVLSIQGDKAQIMDLTDYSVFELDIPEDRKGQINQGEEIFYFEVCDVKTLKELK
jgi:translation initiation factor 5A